LGLFCKVPSALSTSITAISVAPGIDVEAMRTVARERFQVAFAGGLGPMTGRVFRIGHLGSMNPAMILGCLAGIEAAMTVQGIAFGPGGVTAAINSLANNEG
jgi:alanine-glyoxylate transaminase/serine-glyoxylate transaminase/serine-pyruvate transaminase